MSCVSDSAWSRVSCVPTWWLYAC